MAEYRDFHYLPKTDYDTDIKINHERVALYSPKKLRELYPEGDYTVVGETYEKKKQDKKKDIGRIELSGKRLYVSKSGEHNKLLRTEAAYAETEGGGFVALLKLRLLPFLLLLVLIGVIVGLAFLPKPAGSAVKPVDPGKEDPNMSAAEEVTYTVSGTVTKGGEPVEGASLSLQSGNKELDKTVTDENGAYRFENVAPGSYNVVCTAGDSVLTKLADVVGESVTVDFRFPADDLHDVGDITEIHDPEQLPDSKPTEDPSDVKARVQLMNADTPAIAVGGLDIEAMLHMIVGREVDITLQAKLLAESDVPADDKAAIEALSGDLELTYLDFRLLKEVYGKKNPESSEYLRNSKTVLEIAVPFDSSTSAGTYVLRCLDGEAVLFEQLSAKPTGDYRDGTCYVTINTVYIYTNCLCTYAIGMADAGASTKGSDMLVFSDGAMVNVAEKTVTMYYSHNSAATHSARVELYLKGRVEDLLVAKSGIIPPGNELEVMPLAAQGSQLPSEDSYEGYMLVIYLNADGNSADTNVELPVTVTIAGK